MNKVQANKVVIVNLAFWFVAMVLHPLIRILPTGSGSPPKIFEFLIPVFFVMLAGGSTYLLKAAIGKPKDD
ncbi:MAG TPA: hypothetical protein PK529_15695 [Verrucomicrobiales bacterium]|nr:hypothetical protein [Verrucomicrobiales bacterium]